MTRFSEEDRERIRSSLVAEGRELFARHGFERTRIKDVTEAVGIGTSTFYQFFDSKEALYVEVLLVEDARLSERIDEVVAAAGTPREEVRTMLRTVFEAVRTNPLISRLIIENELRLLEERLSEEERESIAAEVREIDREHAERWARSPECRYDDPEVLRGVFWTLAFTTRSRDTIVDRVHSASEEEVETQLIDIVVNGLFGAEATDEDLTGAEATDEDRTGEE